MTPRSLSSLLRPRYAAYPALAGVSGALLANGTPRDAVAAAVLVLGLWWGGMVSNHVLDRDLDRRALARAGRDDGVALEARPVATGAVAVETAIGLAGLLYGVSLALAWTRGWSTFALTVAVIAASHVYNVRLKAAGLAGDVFFAALIGSCFLLGGATAGRIDRVHLAAFACALCFHTGVHIYGCIKDVETDRVLGCATVAVRLGVRRAAILAGLCTGLGIAISAVVWGLSTSRPLVALLGIVSSATISAQAFVRVVRSPSAHSGWLALSRHIWAASLLYGSFALL